jgi:hypothetical protein
MQHVITAVKNLTLDQAITGDPVVQKSSSSGKISAASLGSYSLL